MKILMIICLILAFVLILNISGCAPASETQSEEDEVQEISQLEEDLSTDNLGDLDQDIDDVLDW